jgi:hypothetical protein
LEFGNVVVVVAVGGIVVDGEVVVVVVFEMITGIVVVVVDGIVVDGEVVVVVEVVGLTDVVGVVAVSMTIDNDALAADVFPAVSETIADTVHVPSLSVGKSHVDDTDGSYEQDRVVAPFVADTVISAPEIPPPTPIAGVLSEVLLSVDEVPSSDDESRSGVLGELGAVVSITTEVAGDTAETLFWTSVRCVVTAHVPEVNDERTHPEVEGEAT